MLKIEEIKLMQKEDDTKEYCIDHLGLEKARGRNKFHCPVCGSKDNLSFAPKLNIFKCMGCQEGGDILAMIRLVKNMNFIEACEFYATSKGQSIEKQTTVETKEEIEARQKAFDERQKEIEKKKQAEQKETEQAKKKAITSMTKKAPVFQKALDPFGHYQELQNLVYNQSTTFLDWMDLYVGYDPKHKSICTLNRVLDDKHTTYNIKHREKFVWDAENKKHTDQRVDGKWISNIDSTTYAFPYDYFLEKSKIDNTVFIVEGEKDALNLLSYDINVLTLGGVSTGWEEHHRQLLKDKTVYIWFDNDKAGYKGAINRYNEIKEVASEVYIVVFFHINPSFPNKYDIADFIKDSKFKTKDEIIHSISYSSYKLTTTLIQDIENYTGLDLKEYYFNQPIKKFSQIKKEWLLKDKDQIPLNITHVKGEKDIKNLEPFLEQFKKHKNSSDFANIKSDIADLLVEDKDIIDAKNIIQKEVKKTDGDTDIQDDPIKLAQEKKKEIIDIFTDVFKNYETLYKDYRQTHISDMVEAFENMAKRTDNTFAKYNSGLAIWTGNYYHTLDEKIDDIRRFILKGWMPVARVDKKKRSTQNVEKILEDVYTGAISLNEIKDNQKGTRVINFANGTLFITKKGKITFKTIHSKTDGATNILEFDYHQDAKAPKWEKFLKRVLPNEQDQSTLMEFIGYCFLPSHDYEAFLYLYGKSGANGKSVIMDVIKSFFGKENSSSLDLQDFEGHKLQALENKIINIGSEVDAKGLNKGQMSRLKALTATKDDISIDPKNKDPRTLESEHQPKLIFAGNNKPSPSGMDDGVFRRMLLLTFDSEIKDDEKIRGLSDRFEDEMSGILALALKHLTNLIKKGSFTKSDKLLENIEEYKDQTNPIRRYVSDCLEIDEEVIIPKDFLYQHYKEYMQEKGNMPLSQAKFFSRLKDEMKQIVDIGQQRVNVPNIAKDRPRFIQGIYCNTHDVFSFTYEKEEIQTKAINYDLNTRQVIIKEDVKDGTN
jgi:P4 family phage/plasmid primase-like protien